MNTTGELPVLLLTGYLGSGKTTLLNRILNNRRGIKFAVIVNDIGEVNIDADLIAKDGIVGNDDESLVPLQNGCICCTLKMDLVKQLTDLAKLDKFDYIVIEASGICEPEPIAQTITAMSQMQSNSDTKDKIELDCIVTVVDALRLKDEFNVGKRLTRADIEDEDIENLIIQQIEFCNIILLNKIDEISESEAIEIKKIIKEIQPSAEIIPCNYCDVDLTKLLDTNLFDFESVATSATWVKEIEKPIDDLHEHLHDDHHDHHDHHSEHHHEHEHEHHHHHHHHHHHDHEHGEVEEYGIGTFVYYARKPFSLNDFDRFCAQEWPKSVIRCKGVVYFKENPDMSYLFEQAGSQKQLSEAGKWYATAPEEDLVVLLAQNPDMMRDWDDIYGDRMQKLVFIGKNMDKELIIKSLNSCLRDL